LKLRSARLVTLGGYFGLLTLVVVWHAWLHPPRHFPTALVLTALPLLLPLRGLLHVRVRSHLWASFLMMLYLMHGVVETLTNPPQRLLAILEIALSLTVFTAAALYTRWAQAAENPVP
jgi:uncharacterized membrane protein